MRGMTRQTKSVIAFLAAIFCIVAILVVWKNFGELISIVATGALATVAVRLVKAGRVWNAPPDPGRGGL